jgi:hypothetical protein
MSKVRISPDMKVQQLDPRHMPTQKMDIPPGGIRPPPPPATAEVVDAQQAAPPQPGVAASPWSQNAGIDRSMLPSAAMAPPAAVQAARIPSMPPPRSPTTSSIGPAIWIGVVVVAALLGGGIALALRNGGSSGSADPVSSSAPIAITVPGTTSTANSEDTVEEPDIVVEPNSPESAEDGAEEESSPKTTAPRTAPRRTAPAPKSTTPAPAPAPTTTTRPRLFN